MLKGCNLASINETPQPVDPPAGIEENGDVPSGWVDRIRRGQERD